MCRYILSFFILYYIPSYLFSQCDTTNNLVPNPSFEYYTNCPNTNGDISFAFPWNRVFPWTGGTDYYNSCCIDLDRFSVPDNWVGFEYAHTGEAYAGLGMFIYAIKYRDYLQAPLVDSLISGKQYYVEFYVNLADSIWYGISSIGAFFSVDSVTNNNISDPILHYTPQIINPPGNPLINKNGWDKISGTFIANGGEKWIVLGNFNEDIDSDTLFVDGGHFESYDHRQAYYFVDDVSVYKCEDIDTIIDTLNEITIPNAFTPNNDGTNDIFKPKGNNIRELNGKIINRWGELIYRWSEIDGGWDGKHNGLYVSPGVYFYVIEVTYQDGSNNLKKGTVEVVR